MKAFLPALVPVLCLFGVVEVSAQVVTHYRSTRPQYSACTGSTPCNACRTCTACKYCSQDGGRCGTCR